MGDGQAPKWIILAQHVPNANSTCQLASTRTFMGAMPWVKARAWELVLLGTISAVLWLSPSSSMQAGGSFVWRKCVGWRLPWGVFFSLIVFLIICQMVLSQDYAISQCLLVKIEVNTRLYKQKSVLVYCPGITPTLLRGSSSEGFEDCLLYLFFLRWITLFYLLSFLRA